MSLTNDSTDLEVASAWLDSSYGEFVSFSTAEHAGAKAGWVAVEAHNITPEDDEFPGQVCLVWTKPGAAGQVHARRWLLAFLDTDLEDFPPRLQSASRLNAILTVASSLAAAPSPAAAPRLDGASAAYAVAYAAWVYEVVVLDRVGAHVPSPEGYERRLARS